MTAPGRVLLKTTVWLVALAPLAALGYWIWTDDLTANPISFITNTLGDWTLRLLLASLAMTPLRIVFGLGFATILTLVVTPAALMAIANLSAWRERRKARRAERIAARLAVAQPAE